MQHVARATLVSICAFVLSGFILVASHGVGLAQPSPPALPETGAQPGNGAPTVTQIIELNVASPAKICLAITPLVQRNPAAASEVVTAAQKYPQLLATLAQCLSRIQRGLAEQNPSGAKLIANIVAAAPAEFQAGYAVAQVAADTTAGGNGQGASGNGAQGATGTSGSLGASPLLTGIGGSGVNVVSHSRP
jgi:hypothetical protein